MIKNYFKTTFRNLWKNKGYSFLNIGGLAIGIACAGLIFLWVESELNYNDYFQNQENLYSVKDQQTYDGVTFTFDATPGLMAKGIRSEIPGIKNAARCTWGDQLLFSIGDKAIYDQGHYVDSPLLKMFELKFVHGNATHAFDQLHSLVVNETMAKKFFGGTDVLGKQLKVNNDQEYTITGVVKDLPENVSFHFSWLAPFKIFEDQNPWLQSWGNNGVITYVETEPSANVTSINKKLYVYIQTKEPETNAKMSIYPMSRWRLYNNFDESGNEKGGSIRYVNLFSIIAWIILIIACINFMNLATARSEKRAREVGVRKVMGAGRWRLISQFLGEALALSFFSTALAIFIMWLSLSAFNTLVDKKLSLDLFSVTHIISVIGIATICGVIAGSYPAFYLSSFNPTRVIKGLKFDGGNSATVIRKGLVVLQFSVSVILIISTIMIYRQIEHVKDRELGYNKAGLIYTQVNGKIKQNFGVIRHDLLQSGVVENVSLSNSQVLQLGSNSGNFDWKGKDPSKEILITVEGVSSEYIPTMGMHLKSGRNFYEDLKLDSGNIIINQALAKLMGVEDPVGSIIKRTGGAEQETVVGVIDDFVYNSMYASPAPLILFPDTSHVNILSVRLKKGNDVKASLSSVENVVRKDNPGYPVEFSFTDDSFDRLFKIETLISKLAGIFAVLAVIISCLGLFGLAAYTAERRTKEIGIRKVLGASTQGLAALLSREFLILVMISCLIAFPVSWLLMRNWLGEFQYHISFQWDVLGLSAFLALVIALATVSFQALRAAIANPVKSLRTE